MSSSVRASSSSGHRSKRRRLATEDISAEEAERRRIDASKRLQTVWDDIIARYSVKDADENDEEEDVIDWEDFEIVMDRGAIRQAEARPMGSFADVSGQREHTPSESEALTDDELGLPALTTKLAPQDEVDEGEGAEVIDLCSTSEDEDEDEIASFYWQSDIDTKPTMPPAAPMTPSSPTRTRPLTRAQSVLTGEKPLPFRPSYRRRKTVAPESSDDEDSAVPLRRRTQSISRTPARSSMAADQLTPKTPVVVVVPSRRSRARTRSPSPPVREASSGSDTSDYEDFIARLSPMQNNRSTITPPSSLASELSPFALPALPVKRSTVAKPTMPPPILPLRPSTFVKAALHLPTPSPSPSLRSALRKPGAPPRLSLAPSPAPSSVRFVSPPPDLRSSTWAGDVCNIFDAPLRSFTSPERSSSPLKRLSPLRSDKGEVFYEWPRSVSIETEDKRSASLTSDRAVEEADTSEEFDELLSPRPRPSFRARSLSRLSPYRRTASAALDTKSTTVQTRLGSVTVSTASSTLGRARSATITRASSEIKTRAGTVTVTTVPKSRAASSRPVTPSLHERLRALRSNSVAPSLYGRRMSALPC